MKITTLDELAKRVAKIESETGESPQLKEKVKAFTDELSKYKDVKGLRFHVLTDYDCDGITSGYIMNKTLKNLCPDAEVEVICNDRRGAYGVPKVDDKPEENDIYIVCDTGSNEQAYLKERYPNHFILDHHLIADDADRQEMTDNPRYLNPHSFGKADYCAAGLAYRIYEEMQFNAPLKEVNSVKIVAAIGTTTDVVNLLDPESNNRKIVKEGMRLIDEATPDTIDFSLGYLLATCGMDEYDTTSKNIAFNVGAFFNAPSRMSELIDENGAQRLMDVLLMDEDDPYKYVKIAKVKQLNLDRKNIMHGLKVSDEIATIIDDYTYGDHKDTKICVCEIGYDMPHNFCGLAAGHISGATGKACIVLKKTADGKYAGSGRNIAGNDSLENYVRSVLDDSIEITWGGHDDAIGISNLNNYERFKELVESRLDDFHVKILDEVLVLSADDLTEAGQKELMNKLYALEPVGAGNTIPPTIISGKELYRDKLFKCNTKIWKDVKIKLGKSSNVVISDWSYDARNYPIKEDGNTNVLAEIGISNFKGPHLEFSAKTDRYFCEHAPEIIEQVEKIKKLNNIKEKE
jgi:single-stranded-DNA-specific exonuclease